MVSYDPKVIAEFAEQLYRRAALLVALYAVVGGVVGLVVGLLVTRLLAGTTGTAIALFTGALGAAVGFALGRQGAFLLRLQAQQALCQVQIEANTRASGQKPAAADAAAWRAALGRD